MILKGTTTGPFVIVEGKVLSLISKFSSIVLKAELVASIVNEVEAPTKDIQGGNEAYQYSS